jgi:hypothetical protein
MGVGGEVVVHYWWRGLMSVSVWKFIRREWDTVAKYLRFEVGWRFMVWEQASQALLSSFVHYCSFS